VNSASFDVGSWITLRWTRGTRYYRVHLEEDLWTGWLLTQVHGANRLALGARAILRAALDRRRPFLATIAKRRRQRGYRFDA
jgi:hypothetical protein